MYVLSGTFLCVAICILNLTFQFHVEARNMKPRKPNASAYKRKNDYTIDLEKVDMLETPRDYLSPKSLMYIRMYNDTTKVLFADLFVEKDLPSDCTVLLVVQQFNPTTNQWVEFSRQETLFCNYMNPDVSFIKDVFKAGNLTRGCPLRKGSYYIRDYLQAADEFPRHMNEGKWRSDLKWLTKTKQSFFSVAVSAFIRSIDDDE